MGSMGSDPCSIDDFSIPSSITGRRERGLRRDAERKSQAQARHYSMDAEVANNTDAQGRVS